MNINEIAKLAEVSRATVSRYLNQGYVSAEKKERIRKVIEETGYIPSSQAQMLRTKKTGLIGVIIPKINSDSISRMVAGIGEILSQEGYQLLLASTDNDEKEEISYLQTFKNNHVDGVILMGTIVDKKHKEALEKMEVPVVILGQHVEGHACVFHDDYYAAKQITKLLTKKCKNIAYIGVTPKDKAVGTNRKKGFTETMNEAKLSPVIEEKVAFSMEDGYLVMKKIMKTIPQVDGVFCATDSIAVGAMKAIKECHKQIGKEICVTGMGDSKISTIIEPMLSTIHFHYKTSGMEAARMLVDMLKNDGDLKREVKMGFTLIERDSTKK